MDGREIKILIPADVVRGVKAAALDEYRGADFRFAEQWACDGANKELAAAVNDGGLVGDQLGAALRELANELAKEAIADGAAKPAYKALLALGRSANPDAPDGFHRELELAAISERRREVEKELAGLDELAREIAAGEPVVGKRAGAGKVSLTFEMDLAGAESDPGGDPPLIYGGDTRVVCAKGNALKVGDVVGNGPDGESNDVFGSLNCGECGAWFQVGFAPGLQPRLETDERGESCANWKPRINPLSYSDEFDGANVGGLG